MKHHQITYQPVSRETFLAVDDIIQKSSGSLEEYLDRLLWWNRRINLVSRDVPRETVWEHIRHSLLITQLDCYQKSPVIVDAGTGGGLPGLPLGIVSPEKKVVLNDIVTKKILAVKQISQALGLRNVATKDRSIAKLQIDSPYLLISKHAFKIDELFDLTAGQSWTKMVLYKGIDFKEELENIDTPLSITAYDLFAKNNEPFYKDKALLIVSKK